MKWETIKLGSVLGVKHGYAFKGEYFTDSGQFILLTPGNCYEKGGLKLKGDKEKYYGAEYPDEYLLNEGDLIVVMTDLVNTAPVLGGAFIIPESGKYLHNQRLGLVQITAPKRIDKRFLYFLLNSRDYRGQIRGSASGATVRHTSPGRIKDCSVRIPTNLEQQQRIASTLSAYDDLIENNRRRMALLELSARLLYREWFVHLRFPGHEHAPIKDGVPKGWERKKAGDILTLQRGFDLSSVNRVEGNVPIYASTGVTGFHNVPKVAGPGVITGRSGSLGKVLFSHQDFWPLNTSLWVKDFKGNSPVYVFHLLSGMHLEEYNGGAAVPTLNRNDVHRIEVVDPPPFLKDQFTETAETNSFQIFKLEQVNQLLTKARDALLPRVMKGELIVETPKPNQDKQR